MDILQLTDSNTVWNLLQSWKSCQQALHPMYMHYRSTLVDHNYMCMYNVMRISSWTVCMSVYYTIWYIHTGIPHIQKWDTLQFMSFTYKHMYMPSSNTCTAMYVIGYTIFRAIYYIVVPYPKTYICDRVIIEEHLHTVWQRSTCTSGVRCITKAQESFEEKVVMII